MRAIEFIACEASISGVASPEGAPLLRPPMAPRHRGSRQGACGWSCPQHGRDLLHGCTEPQARPGFDPIKDFAPITLVATVNNLLVVHPSLPVKSVRELITFAKARPGQVSYASGGVGGAQHLAGELFTSMSGMRMTHIPYKGSAPGLTALIGGEVSVGFTDMLITLPQVKSGRLRALAVTGPERSALIPDLPTIAEAGLPGYSVTAWFGLLAPAAAPPEIIVRINAEIVKSLRTPQLMERLAALGADPVGSTPAAFAAHIRNEIAKWSKVVNAAGLHAE